MTAFLAGTAAYAVLFTLVTAVFGHLREPSGLAGALREHGVLPRPAAVAAAAVTAEAALAVLLLLGVLLATPGLLIIGLGGAAALFATYGSYASYLVATGREVPCGCGDGFYPAWHHHGAGSTGGPGLRMTGWVVGRAFVLAVLAGGSLTWSNAVTAARGSVLVLVILAAATFGTLLWSLPPAMHNPVGVRR